MKKYIFGLIFIITLLVVSPLAASASTTAELQAKIASLEKQIYSLKYALYAAVSNYSTPIVEPAPGVTPLPAPVLPIKNPVVTPAPSISVFSPNGGENWKIGNTQTVKWNSSGMNNVHIYIRFPDGGMCFQSTQPASLGFYSFVLNENCPNIPRKITSGQYKVVIWGDDAGNSESSKKDESNASFTINSKIPSAEIVPVKPINGNIISDQKTTANYINQAIEFATKASDSVSKSSLSNADKATAISHINLFTSFLYGKGVTPTDTITSPFSNVYFPIGAVGPDVIRIQKELMTKRCLTLPAGVVPGYWGKLSADALVKCRGMIDATFRAASCKNADDCTGNQYCYFGKCTEAVSERAATCKNADDCTGNQYCYFGKCTEAATERAATCKNADDCTGNQYCYFGKCTGAVFQ